MTSDYVINAGNDIEALEPVDTAEDIIEAELKMNEYLKQYKFADVVYAPVDNEEVNELVYSNY